MDIFRNKNAANTLNSAFLVKKLMHDIPRARAFDFFDKLRDLTKGSDLANDLIEAKNDLEPKKRTNLINKLFKVYAYKVLNKLFDDLENIQKRKIKPLKKDFLDLLHANVLKQLEQTYIDSKQNEIIPNKMKSSFRLKKPKVLKDDKKKKLIYVSILPPLFNYLNLKLLDIK